MARRFHPRSTPAENIRLLLRTAPWRVFVLLSVILVLAIPTFIYGTHLGGRVLPSATDFFYTISGGVPTPSSFTYPPLASVLPQVATIRYTVQDGDSCDSILTFQMHMADAGEIFSDANAQSVRALNSVLGHDCHALQPGLVLPLSAHYPLVALGGIVLKIEATTSQQAVPTPLIKLPEQQKTTVDCSDGCLLTVRIAPKVETKLEVQTGLPMHVGAWVWAQAALARKNIAGFDKYPYVDPTASLASMRLRACDFQMDNMHDDNALSCDQLMPNTIDDDGGSWLVGVIGPSGLNHWGYRLKQPQGTRVLVWLSANNGNLKFEQGNPLYRYDDTTQTFVKV